MKYLRHLLSVLAFLYDGTGAYLDVSAAENIQSLRTPPVATEGSTEGGSRSETRRDRLTILPLDTTRYRPMLTTQTHYKTQLIGHSASRSHGWPASTTAAERGIAATRWMTEPAFDFENQRGPR
jgi:hypothetical protein